MTVLWWILLFSIAGGLLSVVAASSFLFLPADMRQRLLPHLVSFAIGALLGAAFLGLLPHAIMSPGVDDIHDVTLVVLLGILLFFALEKTVLWRHCHTAECEVHGAESELHDHHVKHAPAATLILIGDAVHNFVDGVLIAAAFMTDIHLGVVTALAVATHEIPQEVGDFAILLDSGFSRAKALGYNMLSSMTTVIGALLAYWAMQSIQAILPYVLAIAAASFIYVAVADLIPGLHKRVEAIATLQQVTLISLGVGVIYFTHTYLH